MEWEQLKENVDPIIQERKKAKIDASKFPVYKESKTQRDEQRRGFEDEIAHYKGDDPLDCWIRYIKWTRDTSLSEAHNPQLTAVLQKCVEHFKNDPQYRNDLRYLRIWMSYADTLLDPSDIFLYLHRTDIGTEHALFYYAWALILERKGQYKLALEVLQEGQARKAKPEDKMNQTHREFVKRMAIRAQRLSELESSAGNEKQNPSKVTLKLLSDEFEERRPLKAINTSQPSSFRRDDEPHTGGPGKSVKSVLKAKASVVLKAPSHVASLSLVDDGCSTLEEFKAAPQFPGAVGACGLSKRAESQIPAKKQRVFSSTPQDAFDIFVDENIVNPEPCTSEAGGALRSLSNLETIRRKDLPQDFDASIQVDSSPSRKRKAHTAAEQLKSGYDPQLLSWNGEEQCFEEARVRLLESSEKIREYVAVAANPLPTILEESGTEFASVVESCDDANVDHAVPIPAISREQEVVNSALVSTAAENAGFSLQEGSSSVATQHVSSIFSQKTDILGYSETAIEASGPVCSPMQKQDSFTVSASTGAHNSPGSPPPVLKTRSSFGNLDDFEMNTGQFNLFLSSTEPTSDLTLHTKEAMEIVGAMFSSELSSERHEDGSPFGSFQETCKPMVSAGTFAVSNSMFEADFDSDDVHGERPHLDQVQRINLRSESALEADSICRIEEALPVPSSSAALRESSTQDSSSFGCEQFARRSASAEAADPENEDGADVANCDSEASSDVDDNKENRMEMHDFSFQKAMLSRNDRPTDRVLLPLEHGERGIELFSDWTEETFDRPSNYVIEEEGENQPITNLTAHPESRRTPSPDFEVYVDPTLRSPEKVARSEDARLSSGLEATHSASHNVRASDGSSAKSEQVTLQPNPFSTAEQSALLKRVFSSFLQTAPNFHDLNVDLPDETRRGIQKLKRGNHGKAAKTSLKLGRSVYLLEEIVGQGAFATVFRISNPKDVQQPMLACKIQTPPSPWDYYICKVLEQRIPAEMNCRFLDAQEMFLFKDCSIFVSEYCDSGSLQDLINNYRKKGKSMDESLVAFYAIELLRIVETLHSVGVIHLDIKPDNIMLRHGNGLDSSVGAWAPNDETWEDKGLRLIDFGRSIDLGLYPPEVMFVGDSSTSTFRCPEMQHGTSWKYQADTFATCGVIHFLLFGEYMDTIEVRETPVGQATKCRIRNQFKRYWQGPWKNVFDTLLNLSVTEAAEVVDIERSLRADLEQYLISNPAKARSVKTAYSRQFSILYE